MKIEISLTRKEVEEIICHSFKIQYPDKVVCLESLSTYSDSIITITDPVKPETANQEESKD